MYLLDVVECQLLEMKIELGLMLHIENIEKIRFDENIIEAITNEKGRLFLRLYPLDLDYYEDTNLKRGPSLNDLIRHINEKIFYISNSELKEEFEKYLKNIRGIVEIKLEIYENWQKVSNSIIKEFCEVFNKKDETNLNYLRTILNQPVFLYPSSIRNDNADLKKRIYNIHSKIIERFKELQISAEIFSLK